MRLTSPSRGRLAPRRKPPLTSDVSRLREPKVKGRWAVSSVAPARRSGHLDFQPQEQQASPAARTATVAGNWCLRSRRSRRVAQGRTILPYATPLLLGSSGHGRRGSQPADEHEDRIHQGLFLSGQERLPGGQDQQAWGSVRPASSSGPAARGSLPFQSIAPLCLLPVPGQGQQRLAAEAKQPSQGWQTPPIGGLLNTQPANPSVKGTGLRPAPYVER
jgi:hypothetical protein